jgi:hypothetical protein
MNPPAKLPWYRSSLRWGQTNLTEIDPQRIDLAWWKSYWKRTQIQGIIVNAGGIVAYYPSKHPQHRAKTLGDRDLLAEIFAAGREAGLSLVARLDSNRVRQPFYDLHPDWFCVDAAGKPYRVGPYYLGCVHSPYYDEYMPAVIREIIERVHPDGFADNSWSGMGRDSICHCRFCKTKFKAVSGHDLPQAKNWDDPIYLRWIDWNTKRRLEIWDLNNQVCVEAGGPDCLWAGMARGSVVGQSAGFRDLKALAERSKIVFLDYQSRDDNEGFQGNADAGKLWHDLAGWDTVLIESMAMYQISPPAFRLASRPEPEAHLWMFEGFAGGIQPWWHHIGAFHEDTRQYETAAPVFAWHAANQEFLVNRRPVAPVALLWSQENLDAYGRDQAGVLIQEPYLGWVQALVRHRIPYRVVHIDHLQREAASLEAVILPNLAALSEVQCQALKDFVKSGKGLVATGESSRFDLQGQARPDFGLAEIFGAHATGEARVLPSALSHDWDRHDHHSYLRLHPELHKQGASGAPTARHPVLKGLEQTDLVAFGGKLGEIKTDAATAGLEACPLSYVRPFPIFPPESAYPDEFDSGLSGLVLRQAAGQGRVAFLAADLDRCFARTHTPDQGLLLANLARWACQDKLPLEVEGAGLIDCHVYGQGSRRIVHLVNLSNPAAWQYPADQWIEIGPVTVRLRLEAGQSFRGLRSLVSGGNLAMRLEPGWAVVTVDRIKGHEVLVFE